MISPFFITRAKMTMNRIAIIKMTIKPLLNNDTKFPTYPEMMLCDVDEAPPLKETKPADLY